MKTRIFSGQGLNRIAFRRVCFRHDRSLKSVRRRLAQALLAVRHRAYFAGKPDFAEDDKLFRQRTISKARQHGKHHRQIGGGFLHANAADDIDEHILIVNRRAAVTV